MAYTKLGRIRPVYSGEWSSGRAYTALEMVKTPDGGLSYIAQKDVPAGTPLTNGEYWAVVLDVREVLEAAKNASDRVDAVMDVKANALSATAAGNPVQFSPDEHSIIKPVLTLLPVQSGSGDPSPENIRPITGWTGAELGRAGKNLWSGDISAKSATAVYTFQDGTATFSRDYGRVQGFILSKEKFRKGTYCISFDYSHEGVCDLELRISDEPFADDLSKSTKIDTWYSSENVRYTFTLEKDSFIGFVTNASGVNITLANMQLEFGSIPTAFEPYQGDTFTLNFGQTIYGGTLDWNKGEMVVNTGFAAFDGSENWVVFTYADGRQSFYTSGSNALPGIMPGTYIYVPGICSWSPSVDGYITDILRTDVDSAAIEIKPDVLSKWGIGDLDTFKARLAANHMQIAYKLANPITIRLTPQQITALAGVNTVYGDADEITVHYNKSLNAAFEELKNAILAMGGNV